MFFFNLKNDDSNEIIIGDGSEQNHLHIMATSKKLMSYLEQSLTGKGILHLDCTYKITKSGFPLLVLGITDMIHQFHPIAFEITSHEQEMDFEEFFNGLHELSNTLDINFDPEYILQDAWTASSNAIKKCFPDCQVIMCWFHVMCNVNIV